MRLPPAMIAAAGSITIAVLAFGCSTADGIQPQSAAPPEEPIELVVLHTNDLWGETDPCG